MGLLPFAVICLGLFALLAFAWIPTIERSFQVDRSPAIIKKSALLALLSTIRGVLLIATLTSTLTWLMLVTVQLVSGGIRVDSIEWGVDTLQMLRQRLDGFGFAWGLTWTFLLSGGLALYAYRRGKLRTKSVFERIILEQIAVLEQQYKSGTLEPLEPTSEMIQAQRHLDDIIRQWNELLRTGTPSTELIEQLHRQVLYMEGYIQSLDIQRRLIVRVNPEQVRLPEPNTLFEKIQTFFFSRGLLASLDRSSKVLFTLSMLLLVPALLGLQSPALGQTIKAEVAHLNNVLVQISDQQFEVLLEKLDPPKEELSEEDEEDLEEVGELFESSITNIYRRLPGSVIDTLSQPLSDIKSAVVRDNILDLAAEQNASIKKLDSGLRGDNLDPLEREIVDVFDDAVQRRGAKTKAGQTVAEKLKSVARRDPSFLVSIKAVLKSFQDSASQGELSNALLKRVVGLAAETNLEGEFAKIVTRVSDEFLDPTTFQRILQTQSNQFATDLVNEYTQTGTIPLTNVLQKNADAAYVPEVQPVMRTVFEKLPIEQIQTTLKDFPPAIREVPDPDVNFAAVAKKINTYRNLPKVRKRPEDADALVSFEDWFPAQLGEETRTKRGELIARWLGDEDGIPDPWLGGPPTGGSPTGGPPTGGPPTGGPPTGGPPTGGSPTGGSPTGGSPTGGPPTGGSPTGGPPTRVSPTRGQTFSPKLSRARFQRARSFGRLRGFSRVGGVLIGKEATKQANNDNDFTDLRWEQNGQNIRFILTDTKGQKYRSHQYRISVAYNALNYAADGRPTAVTMVKAPPMKELKILLHPALIDTPMGQRLIELDRFVDKYTGNTLSRRETTARIYIHKALYELAWANRGLFILDRLGQNSSPNTPQNELFLREAQRKEDQKFLQQVRANANVRKAAAIALKAPETLSDPQQSPLTVKEDFFDPTLVKAMVTAASNETLDGFEQNLNKIFEQQYQKNHLYPEALLKRWGTPPPDFVVWSGVREKDFFSRAEDFLTSEDTQEDIPFNFMLQVAFTSAEEDYVDKKPWEFPGIANELHQTVINSVRKDSRSRTILADATEFTQLQRFFRIALDGGLGDRFPIERLLQLSKELSAQTNEQPYRTLRWNARPDLPQRLRRRMTEENKAEIEQLLSIRSELRIERDAKQVIIESNKPLPVLN